MDLDQQRPQVADALAQRVDGITNDFLSSPVASRGQRRQPERDAREVLDDAVMEVGGDPVALDVGRLDGPLQQPRAFLVDALQVAGEPPGQRELEELQKHEAAEQRRGQGPEQPRCAGGDRAGDA